MDTSTPYKILFDWSVFLDREVDETTAETRDGQQVKVTQKVVKPVATRFGIRQPTRRELNQASLFYKKEYNRFIGLGLMTQAMMINKFSNLTGGVLNEQEKRRLIDLAEKDAKLQEEIVAAMNQPDEVKSKLQKEQVKVRLEYYEISAANEAVFANTADKSAASQLNLWFIYNMTLVDRDSKWRQYFEGKDFSEQEEFMWKLEDAGDELYQKASQLMATYVGWYVNGYASTPEQFAEKEKLRLIEEEERKKAAEDAKPKPAAPAVDPAQASADFKPTPTELASADGAAAVAPPSTSPAA